MLCKLLLFNPLSQGTGTCFSLVDGPAHSSAAAVPGRLAVSSLEPIATFFRFSHRFGVLGLPFTAFQLRAISVMFAARMEARLRHSGVLSCEPIQLDVDDGVRGSSGSGVEDCVKLWKQHLEWRTRVCSERSGWQ